MIFARGNHPPPERWAAMESEGDLFLRLARLDQSFYVLMHSLRLPDENEDRRIQWEVEIRPRHRSNEDAVAVRAATLAAALVAALDEADAKGWR